MTAFVFFSSQVLLLELGVVQLHLAGLGHEDGAALRKEIEEFVCSPACDNFRLSPGNVSIDAVRRCLGSTGILRITTADWNDIRTQVCRVVPRQLGAPPADGDDEETSTALDSQEQQQLVLHESSTPASRYASMSRHSLMVTLQSRDNVIVDLRKRIRAELQLNRRQSRRMSSLASPTSASSVSSALSLPRNNLATRQAQHLEDQAVFAIEKKKKGVRLTPRGSMALAVRRSVTNIAARDLGSVLLMDIAHTTVSRAEEDFAAAQTAGSRIFHMVAHSKLQDASEATGIRMLVAGGESKIRPELEDLASQVPTAVIDLPRGLGTLVPFASVGITSRRFQLAFHGIRSDATNSEVWHRSKLQVTQVCSHYLLEPEAIAHLGNIADNTCILNMMVKLSRWADLQRVTRAAAVYGKSKLAQPAEPSQLAAICILGPLGGFGFPYGSHWGS